MKRAKPKTELAWAWEIQNNKGEWVLCRWAESSKFKLNGFNRPSDEARKVCVRLIRNKDYRLGKRAKGKGK